MFNLLNDRLLQLLYESGGGSGGGSGTQDPPKDDPPKDDPPKDDPPTDDPPKDDPPKDQFPWDEHNRLKREQAERARKDREAEDERKKAEGKHEEVITGLQTKNKELEDKLDRIERSGRVSKVAKRVGFYDPEDAARHLTTEQMEDERSIEAALKDLKKEKPRLFDDTDRSGGDIDNDSRDTDPGGKGTGGGDGGTKTFGIETLRSVKRKDT